MARHIETGVREIMDNPDPTKSANLVIVAESTTPEEIDERVTEAGGEITEMLPGGVFIAEIPEPRVGALSECECIDSISINGRLELA